MAAHSPALNAEGYLFQLPSLGLPDPSGEWVTLRCAIGDHKTCALLLNSSNSNQPIDLIKPDSKQEVVEAELEGAIWSFPLLSSSPSASRPKAKAGSKLLNVYVKRQSSSSYASGSRAQERTKLPDGITLVFLNKVTRRFEYETPPSLGSEAKKENEDTPQDLSISNAPANIQNLTNSTASTSAAQVGRRRAHFSMDAATVRAMIQHGKRARAHAHESWESRINAGVNNRLRQMQEDDTAASLPQLSLASGLAISSASHNNRPGVPKGSNGKERTTTSMLQWLLPLPLWTLLSQWMRSVVSLFRPRAGTSSVAKRQWPPRRTGSKAKVRGQGREELGGWWRDGGSPKAFLTRLLLAVTLLYLFAVFAHPVGSGTYSD